MRLRVVFAGVRHDHLLAGALTELTRLASARARNSQAAGGLVTLTALNMLSIVK